MIWLNNILYYPYFENSMPLEDPPVFYTILQSLVEYHTGEKPSPKNIAVKARPYVFDFYYPKSMEMDQELFELNFIRHFLQRRIGTETWYSWYIEFQAKINEIMPKYIPMFDSLHDFSVFKGGSYTLDISDHELTDSDKTGTRQKGEEHSNNTTDRMTTESTTGVENTTESTANTTDDLRHSDTPQNHLNNIRDGEYVTDYNYNQGQSTATTEGSSTTTVEGLQNSQGTDTGTRNERENTTENQDTDRTYTRHETKNSTIENKAEMLLKYQQEVQSIYTMIYKDCDELFFQKM